MTHLLPITQYSELTAPLLFMSSEDAGWDDLIVRAYHEPMELEGWIDPVVPDVALMLMTRGKMLIERRRRDGSWLGVQFNEGSLSIKAPGSVVNEIRWRALSPEPMQTLHIHLNNGLLCRVAEELAGRDPARLTVVGQAGFHDSLVTQIGLALWRELEEPTPTGKLYAQTAAQMLAVHLLRHYAEVEISAPPQTGLTRKQIHTVTDFIHTHLIEDLSLEALAGQVGFSAYHFARLFRQATGHSPHQYVLLQRIAKAQRLLRRTDMSLMQVALESGFANQSHFTKHFRRHTGVTPKAYRGR